LAFHPDACDTIIFSKESGARGSHALNYRVQVSP
jgi:hypothetical protein